MPRQPALTAIFLTNALDLRYLGDYGNRLIRAIDLSVPGNLVSTFAGPPPAVGLSAAISGTVLPGNVNGVGTSVRFNQPVS